MAGSLSSQTPQDAPTSQWPDTTSGLASSDQAGTKVGLKEVGRDVTKEKSNYQLRRGPQAHVVGGRAPPVLEAGAVRPWALASRVAG
eukprot:8900688-Karenia_brevis.AAC.1